MRCCQRHWDMLRQEVIDQGLGAWIASDGEVAVEQLADQLARGEDTKVNYDPLMSCWFMIMTRTLGIAGLAGMHPEFGCPVCRLNEKRTPEGACACGRPECPKGSPGSVPDFETWLVGPESCVTAAHEYMRTRGWIEGDGPAVCPECRQGKCGNCNGTAWDAVADKPTSCACPDGSHR